MLKRLLYVFAMFFPVIITLIGLAFVVFGSPRDSGFGLWVGSVGAVVATVVHYICVWVGQGKD